MNGSLRAAWEHLYGDIWDPLADFTAGDVTSPPDLYSDLFACAGDFLSPAPTSREFEEARNDPDRARQRFEALRGADFTNEASIVRFIEEAHDVIADYEIPGFEEHLTRLTRVALAKYNLRYRLDDPFWLRYLIPGSFANLYAELVRVNNGNPDLDLLWQDFEAAFDDYARTLTDANLRTSIAKASNYLEGLAGATNGSPGTLGRLCDRLTDWPHDKVRDAVKNLYHFCSDYPGIRHAGTPGSRRRALDARDSIAINVSLLALAAYLTSGLDQASVLGSGSAGSMRVRRSPGEAPTATPRPSRFVDLLARLRRTL